MIYDEDRHRIGQQPVIRSRPGNGTGETVYQTADGVWWRSWDGRIRTGERIETLIVRK